MQQVRNFVDAFVADQEAGPEAVHDPGALRRALGRAVDRLLIYPDRFMQVLEIARALVTFLQAVAQIIQYLAALGWPLRGMPQSLPISVEFLFQVLFRAASSVAVAQAIAPA